MLYICLCCKMWWQLYLWTHLRARYLVWSCIQWFIGTLPDRPRDYTIWSTWEPSGVDSRTWAGVVQVGSATRCKLAELVPWMHKFAKQGRVRIFRNERTRSTPLDPKLMFWGVLDHFDTAWKSTQNSLNWCHYRTSSLNKVVSEFFATNATDPLHLTKNSYFGVFRTVSLLHESQCKTGRTGAIIAQVQ
jgi:hypothetical protein